MPKIDPRLQLMMGAEVPHETLSWEGAPISPLSTRVVPHEPRRVRVMVRYTGEVQDVAALGIHIRSVAGDVLTGEVAIDQLSVLESAPNVRYVEAPRALVPDLDWSAAQVGATLVHTQALLGSRPYTGRGVIVGIIDNGIDFTHPDFRNPDGSSRILYLWDQSLMPIGSEHSPPEFGYGVEYTKDQIDAVLAGRVARSHVRHQDNAGHGTHVAGIAAGNGQGTGDGRPAGTYVGMAPEADIIFVHNVLGGATLADSVQTLEAMDYIFRRAVALGRPAVINLSQGMNGGSHDGTSLLSQGINNLLREQPGRAVVKSAGNEYQWDCHAAGLVPVGNTIEVEFRMPAGNRQPDFIELWYPAADRLTIALRLPDGSQTPWHEAGGPPTVHMSTNGNRSFILSELHNPNNGDNRLFVQIESGLADTIQSGAWKLLLRGLQIANGRFDAWIERTRRDAPEQPRFTGRYVDRNRTISSPGNAHEVITVTAYDRNGNIADFASRGPTRDGRLKPDLGAPGVDIVSTLATGLEDQAARWNLLAPDGVHWAMSGTSTAAPHVAGLIALLFEYNPRYSAQKLKALLTAIARQDGYTNQVPNEVWGHGKVRLDYVGNLRNRCVHRPTGPFVPRIVPQNQVHFEDLDEAWATGYRGCWFCLPDQYR